MRDARVGILLPKSIEQVVALLGTSMAGGTFVLINTILKEAQVKHILTDCEVAVVVSSSRWIGENHIDDSVTQILVDGTGTKATHWRDIEAELSDEQHPRTASFEDMAEIIYTSGSTGMPKGVVLTHRNIIDGAVIVSGYLGITEADKLVAALPFNFDYGFNQLSSALLHGCSLVLHEFTLPMSLLETLRRHEITGFGGLRPMWLATFADKRKVTYDHDFPKLRYITNTGGKVPVAVLEKMRACFPHTQIFLMYGLTEAFRSTFLSPSELDRRPTSIGKAIPNVEILVVDDHGNEVPPGVPGELVHRGALISRGYWNDPERTTKVFRKRPGAQPHLNEVVVYSGDLVQRDQDGFLYYLSRKDELIKSAGFRVSPTEIEEVLLRLSGATYAVVFGEEAEDRDVVITAVLEVGASPLDVTELMQRCKQELPRHMCPHRIVTEDSFPRTANGKVDRSGLKRKWSR